MLDEVAEEVDLTGGEESWSLGQLDEAARRKNRRLNWSSTEQIWPIWVDRSRRSPWMALQGRGGWRRTQVSGVCGGSHE